MQSKALGDQEFKVIFSDYRVLSGPSQGYMSPTPTLPKRLKSKNKKEPKTKKTQKTTTTKKKLSSSSETVVLVCNHNTRETEKKAGR